MKVRQGLVSNSSSSSFYFLAPEEAYQEALERVHPYIQWIIRGRYAQQKEVRGVKFIHAGGYVSSENEIDLDDYPHAEILDCDGKVCPIATFNRKRSYPMDEMTAVGEFLNALKKTSPEVITSFGD